MDKDKERYNRSKKPTPLSKKEAQSILKDISNCEIKRLEYLEGGFSNTNYLVTFKSGKEPVVIRSADLTSKQFDIETSISTIFTNINAPSLLKKTTLRGMNLAVYKYYEGELLSRLVDKKQTSSKLAVNIGKSLANVHQVEFIDSGFFNKRIEVDIITQNFGTELVDFTLSNLKNTVAIKKMGVALNNQVISLIESYKKRLAKLENTRSLVHFDFNPKNLIVHNDEVKVILD